MVSLLSRLRFRLNPARSEHKYNLYDSAGFLGWHAACRGVAAQETEAESNIDRQLDQDGFAVVEALSASECAELLARLYRLKIDPRKDGAVEWAEDFDVGDRQFADQTLASILRPPIAAALRRRFGSEFMVYWWMAARTVPGKSSTRSMCWHCDTGPTRHLKLLVYLEDSSQSGGSTEFLAPAASDRLRQAGYTFGATSRRTTDLGPLARALELDARPIRPELRAGQALIFEPTRTLHRGVVPTLQHRHVVTLCLLPSPVDWRIVARSVGFPGRNMELGWPEHVGSLAEKMAPVFPPGFSLPN